MSRRSIGAWLTIATVISSASMATASHGPHTRQVNVSSNEVPADRESHPEAGSPDLSRTGRFIAFASGANNLVGQDTKGNKYDVFVRDHRLGITRLVSQNSNEVGGDDASFEPAISASGRFVAFTSRANNLVPHAQDDVSDVFLRDMKLGRTYLVSQSSNEVASNGDSFSPALSDNGRFVAFTSLGNNLIPHDTDAVFDVFVRDMRLGQTYLVSQSSEEVDGNEFSGSPSVSGNGQLIAFGSIADNLVPGDANGTGDVFVRNIRRGTTTLVSLANDGAQSDDGGSGPSISRSGRFVAFSSRANNLAAGDSDGDFDVFLRDRRRGRTLLISQSSSEVIGDGRSSAPSVSGSGRFVAFTSEAGNFTGNDTDAEDDIFVRDRRRGRTYLISQSSTGEPSNAFSFGGEISRNGRFVAFLSDATNFAATDPASTFDVFRRGRLRY